MDFAWVDLRGVVAERLERHGVSPLKTVEAAQRGASGILVRLPPGRCSEEWWFLRLRAPGPTRQASPGDNCEVTSGCVAEVDAALLLCSLSCSERQRLGGSG